MNMKDKIPGAKNFTFWELIKSDTAMRLGIDNTPNETHIDKLILVAANILQPVRDHFGPIRVTSGYRSVALCEAVGSNKNSNHARGEAVDFEPFDSNIKMIDIIEFIYNNLEYRELIAEYFPNGWIHCAYRNNNNIKKLKLKDANHNYSVVDLNYLKEIYN